MVSTQKIMTVIVMFPYLTLKELTKFCQLNKACRELMLKVNYKVLCEAWGVKLSSDLVAETQISTSIALQVLCKFMMLNHISESQYVWGLSMDIEPHIIATVPNMSKIENKSVQELRDLRITQVSWNDNLFFDFTLNDG